MTDTPELKVWREAKEAYHSQTNPFPTASREAAAAVIRSYGDQRYQAAIDDVVKWLESEATPYPEGSAYSHAANEITRRFGKGQGRTDLA